MPCKQRYFSLKQRGFGPEGLFKNICIQRPLNGKDLVSMESLGYIGLPSSLVFLFGQSSVSISVIKDLDSVDIGGPLL